MRSRPSPVSMFLRAARRGSGSRTPVPRAALVLHEDEVPDLEVALLVGRPGRRRRRARGRGRSRSRCTGRTARARPSTSSCPPCRGAGCGRRAADVAPERRTPRRRRGRRWPRAARGRSRSRSSTEVEQLPGERDGALLEVVAEAEVAAHLEERAVAAGLADVRRCRWCARTSARSSRAAPAAAGRRGSTA